MYWRSTRERSVSWRAGFSILSRTTLALHDEVAFIVCPWSECSVLYVTAEVRTLREHVTQQGGVACKLIFFILLS